MGGASLSNSTTSATEFRCALFDSCCSPFFHVKVAHHSAPKRRERGRSALQVVSTSMHPARCAPQLLAPPLKTIPPHTQPPNTRANTHHHHPHPPSTHYHQHHLGTPSPPAHTSACPHAAQPRVSRSPRPARICVANTHHHRLVLQRRLHVPATHHDRPILLQRLHYPRPSPTHHHHLNPPPLCSPPPAIHLPAHTLHSRVLVTHHDRPVLVLSLLTTTGPYFCSQCSPPSLHLQSLLTTTGPYFCSVSTSSSGSRAGREQCAHQSR